MKNDAPSADVLTNNGGVASARDRDRAPRWSDTGWKPVLRGERKNKANVKLGRLGLVQHPLERRAQLQQVDGFDEVVDEAHLAAAADVVFHAVAA